MGGFVVTNAIRALSDLFARDALRPRLNAGTVDEHTGGTLAPVSPNIGNALTLMRFVLASPDISAEALLSNRANYLAASLRRFREAYLFSNEGDEVLRQISTTTNYFSFPTKTWRHGYRLGSDAMVEFVRRIAARVKARQRGFLVISQNGDALLPEELSRRHRCVCTRGSLPRRGRGRRAERSRQHQGKHRAFETLCRGAKARAGRGISRMMPSKRKRCGGKFPHLACLGFDATVAAYGQISQGPRVFIRSKATCAAPLREVLSPCRGLRPHHVQRDRIGSWEVSRPAVRVV